MNKVEFTVNKNELRSAIEELCANRGRNVETDFADLLVSLFAVTLSSVGTESELPTTGAHPGAARIPLGVLKRAAQTFRTFKSEDLTVVCTTGHLKIGSMMIRHPDIELGIIPDQGLSVPVDLPVLDTLALGTILTPQQIVSQGLRDRIEQAQKECAAAVEKAASALADFGVDNQQLAVTVDANVAKAASRIRKNLG